MADVWVTIIFCILGCLIHITGLALLHKQYDRNIRGTQKYLIVSLSLTEISFLIITGARDFIFYRKDLSYDIGMYLSNYQTIVSTQIYYFTMFGITIDRYLEIRMNIKYSIYFNAKKTIKLLITLFITLNTSYFTYLGVVIHYKRYELPLQVLLNFHKYVTPAYNITFVTTACSIYLYIFNKIYKNWRANQRLKKSVMNADQTEEKKFRLIQYLIPLWIIITFILFQILPDTLFYFYITQKLPSRKAFRIIIVVLFRIGYITDPIIYIYNLEIVRQKLKRLKGTVSFNTTSSTE